MKVSEKPQQIANMESGDCRVVVLAAAMFALAPHALAQGGAAAESAPTPGLTAVRVNTFPNAKALPLHAGIAGGVARSSAPSRRKSSSCRAHRGPRSRLRAQILGLKRQPGTSTQAGYQPDQRIY